MASTTIQVSPEMLKQKAKQVRDYKAEHDEVMNKMKTLIYGLNEVWKGDAQTALLQKYEGMQSTFANFSELIEAYAVLMDATAEGMRSEDQAAAARINNTFS